MSMQIKSLHKDNILYTYLEGISSFESILISSHTDTIENATDRLIVNLYLLQDRLHFMKSMFYSIHNVKILCGSGYRTEKINELIGGSKTSQHKDAKALDIHFFDYYHKRIRGHKNLYKFRDTIEEIIGDDIIQMFVYDWGIHVGFATAERVIKHQRGDR